MPNECVGMTKSVRLYDYQHEIVARLQEAWRHHRSVMVQMPTGTGKTHVLAALVSEECGAKGMEHDGATVVIVAHRRELVAQIKETVKRFGISEADGRVKVWSIQWLSRHWEDVKEVPELVVIDEAHHAVAKTYKEIWSRWPKARFLGLTATPCRMNRRGFTDLFDTLICSWSIAEFIKKGYLSAFDYVSIRQGSEEQRLIDSLEKRGADGDYQVKEMDSVLNRNTSIDRLYRSIEQFAAGKKGIVYAISIGHARRIAGYYSSRRIKAVAIDSRTPAAERKRMVEDFKAGRTKVLVNVDIFSEGFDCPDVEFVQMARPTLSLAKYLQQVGRGLRRSEGKQACVLIDNVGLHRVFGLPVVAWDWESMFQGFLSGKAVHVACLRDSTGMAAVREELAVRQEEEMEVIMSHEQLLADIGNSEEIRPVQADSGGLKAWQDKENGLWGLRRGRDRITGAVFATVLDTGYGMAAVMFEDKDCGIVNDTGEIVWKKEGYSSARFLKDGLLLVNACGKKRYVDIYSWRTYTRKPKVRRFGNVELLEIGDTYYSRTKTVYVNSQGVGRQLIRWQKFYLTIYDKAVPFPASYNEDIPSERYAGHACILESDREGYYWLYLCLADGSIIIMDNNNRYYHATEGQPKKYIGCRSSEEEWNRCIAEFRLLAKQTEVMVTERIGKRRQQLAECEDVVPFRSGAKWGLKAGNRVIVPPVYRMVRFPVGMYCAVEKNYGQWGIISIDGTLLIETKYTDVSIEGNGTAVLTQVTGKTVSVKLQ